MLPQSRFALGDTRRGASRFASSSIARYSVRVAETTVTRFGDRRCSKADNRLRAVFLRPYTLRLLWSGLGGGAFAHAGSLGRRFANPALCPATPFGDGAGFVNPSKEVAFNAPALARPYGQQSHLIRSIVRAALRDAATASTYQDALDATGAASAAIAALVRAEVRHG